MIIKSQPESPLRHIILVLSGFHTEMGFLGPIGSLVDGSILGKIIFQVYVECRADAVWQGSGTSCASQ